MTARKHGSQVVISILTTHSRIRRLMGALLAGLCLAAAGWCASMDADPGFVTDIIVGHNNKGPYSLSWTNIDSKSVTVVTGGRSLRGGNDYNLDVTNGIIGFNSVVVNDTIVRVSYRTIPGKSKRAVGNLNIPISLSLFQRQDASIKLLGMYAHDDPTNPEAGKSVFGFNGDKRWASSKITSMLLLSQRTAEGGEQAGIWDRSAFKLGGDTKVGALSLTGSYLHSGNEFAGSKEYGLGLGRNTMDFAASFAPSKTIQATANYQKNEATAGETAGNYSARSEQGLAFTPGDSTRLSFTHSTTETRTAAAGSDQVLDSNLFRLDQGFGGKTKAVMTFENATIDAGGQTDQVTTRALNLTSSPLQRFSFRTALAVRDSELYGAEKNMAFGITAKPVDSVSVDVGVGTLQNQTVGGQLSTNVKVTASPVEQLAVQAALSTTNTANDREQFQRDFSLSSAPTRYSRLTATLSQKGVNELDDVTKGAQLELKPLANMQLTTGYRYIENGAAAMTIWDYAATAKPWDAFSFAGSVRNREIENDQAPDSASFQLALSPRNYFSLTGDYRQNPEDTQGIIQPYKSKTVGLCTKIGSVGLHTDFTQKDEYQLSRFSDERGIGLEMPAFGHGRLSTGVKLARILDGSELTSYTYSLGYSHSVGSDFSLSFTGCYTQYLRDRISVPGADEYKAEGSLGFKF